MDSSFTVVALILLYCIFECFSLLLVSFSCLFEIALGALIGLAATEGRFGCVELGDKGVALSLGSSLHQVIVASSHLRLLLRNLWGEGAVVAFHEVIFLDGAF